MTLFIDSCMLHVKDKNLAINFAWRHLKISHLLVNASFLNDPISLKGYGIRDHHGNKRLKRYNNNHECHGFPRVELQQQRSALPHRLFNAISARSSPSGVDWPTHLTAVPHHRKWKLFSLPLANNT